MSNYPPSLTLALPNSGPADLVGSLTMTPVAASSGVRSLLTITAPADTGLTATTEQVDVYLNLAATRTWATGAINNQRFVRISAPTIAFAGASTVTNAATVYIEGAPVAGTNATLTNSYALFVDAGRVLFDDTVVFNAAPEVYSDTQTGATPTVSRPAGVVRVPNGATTVTVTNTLVSATSLIFAQIRNATTSVVSVANVVPGAGSFIINLSGDPGASNADVAFLVVTPGAGV